MARLGASLATLLAATAIAACGGGESQPAASPDGGSEASDGVGAERHAAAAQRRAAAAERLSRQGRAGRQHRQRVRLLAAVRGPRGPLPRASRRRLRDPRLPRRRRRRPGAALRRGDRPLLQVELRRLVPDVREVQRRLRAAEPGVRAPRRGGRPADLELQQVPPRPQGRGGRALRGRDRAGGSAAQREHREAPARADRYAGPMCRNIRTLHNFEPPATAEEVHDAALQYVRKISGSTKPSQANAEAFERAVEEVAAATTRLLDGLVTRRRRRTARSRPPSAAPGPPSATPRPDRPARAATRRD